jgi:hypothetical protein
MGLKHLSKLIYESVCEGGMGWSMEDGERGPGYLSLLNYFSKIKSELEF